MFSVVFLGSSLPFLPALHKCLFATQSVAVQRLHKACILTTYFTHFMGLHQFFGSHSTGIPTLKFGAQVLELDSSLVPTVSSSSLLMRGIFTGGDFHVGIFT